MSRKYLGSLPAGGQWVRLEVPASAVGLEGHTLSGFAFTLYGGRASIDRLGKAQVNGPQWLVADHLGTPRMVADKTGSLAGIRRHDYLPFGEEIGAGVGGRTAGQGYGQVDNVRQHFTSKERDNETGLDYFGYRYYSSTSGRWTSVDPLIDLKRNITEPQAWNEYQYCINNPTTRIDPDGQQDSIGLNGTHTFEQQLKSQGFKPEEIKEIMEGYRKGQKLGVKIGIATIGAFIITMEAPGIITAALGWAARNPEQATQIAEDLVQASSGNPSPARLGTPLTDVFQVDKGTLLSGKFLVGNVGEAQVAGQFTKNGDTLVAGIVGVFNKEGAATIGNSTIKSLLNSIKDLARGEGASKIELQAIAVVNKDLRDRLISTG
ncbi:MAG: RHS repeat domain-containing protein [Pyrinomonadaceae bacterium]